MNSDPSCCGCSDGQRCSCICHRDQQRSPGTPAFTVQVQWHGPDRVHAAALVRDGQPWHLGGALVGMGGTPGKAVDDLAGTARYLVIHGHNYLTTEPLSLADREWLFSLLAGAGMERDDEMYAAIRTARAGRRIIGGTGPGTPGFTGSSPPPRPPRPAWSLPAGRAVITRVPPGSSQPGEPRRGDAADWAAGHPHLVEDVIRFTLGRKTVWATLVQRHLRVGFARAVILLDVLEQRGIVGPAGSDGKRAVLVPPARPDNPLAVRRPEPDEDLQQQGASATTAASTAAARIATSLRRCTAATDRR